MVSVTFMPFVHIRCTFALDAGIPHHVFIVGDVHCERHTQHDSAWKNVSHHCRHPVLQQHGRGVGRESLTDRTLWAHRTSRATSLYPKRRRIMLSAHSALQFRIHQQHTVNFQIHLKHCQYEFSSLSTRHQFPAVFSNSDATTIARKQAWLTVHTSRTFGNRALEKVTVLLLCWQKEPISTARWCECTTQSTKTST